MKKLFKKEDKSENTSILDKAKEKISKVDVNKVKDFSIGATLMVAGFTATSKGKTIISNLMK